MIMKYFIISLLILIGCSKHDPAPDLSGHWVFSTDSIGGDFAIVHSGSEYDVAAGGSFSIKGVSYTTGYTNISPNGSYNGINNYIVVLRTVVDQNDDATYLQFNLATNTNYSIVTGGNPVSYHFPATFPSTQPVNGEFNIKSFPITRK